MVFENFNSFFNFFNLKSDTSPSAFTRSPKNDSLKTPDLDAPELKTVNVNAAQLGVYTPDQIRRIGIEALRREDFNPITQGDPKTGQYSSRFLYLENGTISQPNQGTLGGRFVLSTEYSVRGVPSRSSENSTQGQFPVNGQFNFQGAYPTKVDFSSSRVLNGQYAVSTTDIINDSFTSSGIVNAKGEVVRGGPFLISQAELLNGRYQIRVQDVNKGLLQIEGQNYQQGSQNLQQGQLLVNGINSFEGKIRLLNQFDQRATILLDGSYSSEGKFIVNGTALENGSNSINSRYSIGSIQGTATALFEGRYSSGGQFIITQNNGAISSSASQANAGASNSIQKTLQDTFRAYTQPEPGRIFKLNT